MNFVQRFLISTLISFLFSINVYATTWYVNDTSTVGDSFTSAAGYNTQSGMTADSPMRTISSVMPLMSPGTRCMWMRGRTPRPLSSTRI